MDPPCGKSLFDHHLWSIFFNYNFLIWHKYSQMAPLHKINASSDVSTSFSFSSHFLWVDPNLPLTFNTLLIRNSIMRPWIGVLLTEGDCLLLKWEACSFDLIVHLLFLCQIWHTFFVYIDQPKVGGLPNTFADQQMLVCIFPMFHIFFLILTQ